MNVTTMLFPLHFSYMKHEFKCKQANLIHSPNLQNKSIYVICFYFVYKFALWEFSVLQSPAFLLRLQL